ncbi:E3 ubiquitin-protein ligase rnf213-alpha-like [Mercenaria mercenaria]|uniref:E3 ubiquitin-protein ligase rnf213-alpha-like n=1 Tax=Mercenaria mercenaria TaxID=6596 RepID=UPI00234F5731|nr:E3 ubiquitin-protein ligase rnf213-alpha-like [Mercenaria mercenaria]
MSLIRDAEDDKDRSTLRISLVLSILQNSTEKDSASFVNGITVFIRNIQAVRESMALTGNDWLTKEAASFAFIQKFGTLRRACLQSIESKISPILSGIFAELDTNQNLSILDTDSDNWYRSLWLSLLNTYEIREHMKNIKYGNTENVVTGRGFGDCTFQNRMPFSWITIQTFEKLVKQLTTLLHEHNDGDLNPLLGLLEETGLQKSLESVGKEHFYEALEAYISDFTETVYPEAKDRNLVALYLKHYALSMAARDQNTSLTYTLFCVHRVYEESSSCLKHFRDISCVWEGCNDVLVKRKSIDFLEEHDLALLALYFIVDSVSPESKQLEETFDNQVGREKWLARVNRYSQIVNQTFTAYQALGNQSEQLGKAKNMWNCVVVMQLFIENVCLKAEEQSSTFRCRPLWMLLSKTPEVNMKQIDTLKNVEKFLKLCLTKMKNESVKKAEKCKKCGGKHSDKSKTLSCTHEICAKCIEEVLSESVSGQKCPVCKKVLEADWNTKDDDEETVKRWIADKVGDYRQRCNSFLMEVVSQLCFGDNTPPDPEVIDWLISCSFQNVTELEADIGIEQNKVFQSFIFKHLVRTDEKELRVHLEKYIQTPVKEASRDLSDVPCEDVVLTVIHSFEDKISESMMLRNADEVSIVRRCFNLALISIESKESVVDQIFAIARARVGLSSVAKFIDKLLFYEDSINANSKKDIEELLLLAKELCGNREWPWRYLILYIAREFGVDALLSACKSPNVNINWIQKAALQEKVQDTVDIYTACGDKYIKIKQLLLATLISEDANNLFDYIQKSTNKQHLVVMLELAVHREIEIPRALKGKDKTEEQIAVVKQAFQSLPEDLNANSLALDQTVIKQMQLDVSPQKDNDRDINIKCLIFHWLCVIRHLESNCCTVLKPLFQIAVEPWETKNFFLPCMPHDILAGLRATLLETAKEKYAGQNTVYFQCENGHPYEVGNCGRPVATGAKCFCGSPIGGTAYNVLHEKNRPVDNIDRTLPGHCLGVPNDRVQGAVPERSLSLIQCALLKFLLHMTMYIGCGKSTKDICALIKPKIEDKLVHSFLWDHILLDLKDLQGALSLNADEILLLSHCCVDAIMEKGLCEEETHDAAEECTLSTKEGRDKWEDQFADIFLRDIVDAEERKIMIVKASELLQNSNSLLAMLNECTDELQDQMPEGIHDLDKNPNIWKYRTPVSLSRLGQAFQRKLSEDAIRQNSYPMLEIFLIKQSEIQAVRFVPSILQLHKVLLRRYSRQIFKSEALKITVAQLRKDKVAGEETDTLLEDLIEAWNATRKVLDNSIVRTDKGSRIVSQEMSTDVSTMDITDDTAVVYLLPTMEGKGICTYALLDQLIQCHNDVIERYKYSDRGQRDTGFTSVQPKDITSAHVISYHPQDDLLPIVMANCSISTKHSTEDEYDFEKIEKRIVERFISTKSRVIKRSYLQIELMTYRSSLTPASKLEHLRKKIIQEPFETAVKTTLCSEIRDVPVISQILSKLDIAINFLDITGGDPDDSLHDFMTDRLKMNKNVLTAKMQQACSLKHVRALWLALSLHRSNIMVQQNKPTEMIFENIEPEYHAQVPVEIKQTYTKYLQVLPKERLFQILDVVYEFITVVLTETENKEDEDYVDRGHFSLDECLGEFTEDINVPEDILCIHSLHFWVEVSRLYDIRIKERITAV